MNSARWKKNAQLLHFIHKAIHFISGAIEIIKLQSTPQLITHENGKVITGRINWTGSIVDIVELIYGIDEMKCINNGDLTISDLTIEFSKICNIEIKDCYSAYVDIKRRKNNSRTYFLDKMRDRLNKRMSDDDELEKRRH